ncbi:MAG: GntR family transcriptional regulator [Lachnospiraceae bacterium]|nr:GntR family transcriptional regulator [Lachnospiraceae bacterium]
MKLDINIDEYLPLREVVFKTLRNAIIQGEFQPGERLMEITLAKKLGVSRTPVREAIRMLELEGLVVMIPRKGAEVANITVKDLKDALEVRMALESLSVRLACERIDDEGKEELKSACMKFKEAINSKLVPAIVEADEHFHNVIYKASKNPKLINMAQNLREQVYRYRVEYVKDFSYHDNLIREHDQITMAILKGDKESAERIMDEHIYNQEQIVIRNVRNANS